MRKHMKGISILLLVLMMMSFIPMDVYGEDSGQGKEILVLGNDLTPQMISELKKVYGIDHPVEELIITNKEEHEALGEYISAEVITNKSMSSAYIKLLNEGEGIRVSTHNINWVTEDMYRNALSTAGIKDAEVVVAGPIPVSGTAALTGSMKAYEAMTGEAISEDVKDTATDEMVTTAELSDSIGKEEAEKIITEVKIFIVENDITDEETIKKAILDASENIGVELSDKDISSITNLMTKIGKLDLDVDQIKSQLGDLVSKLDGIEVDMDEVKGFLGKILDVLKNIWNSITGAFN